MLDYCLLVQKFKITDSHDLSVIVENTSHQKVWVFPNWFSDMQIPFQKKGALKSVHFILLLLLYSSLPNATWPVQRPGWFQHPELAYRFKFQSTSRQLGFFHWDMFHLSNCQSQCSAQRNEPCYSDNVFPDWRTFLGCESIGWCTWQFTAISTLRACETLDVTSLSVWWVVWGYPLPVRFQWK